MMECYSTRQNRLMECNNCGGGCGSGKLKFIKYPFSDIEIYDHLAHLVKKENITAECNRRNSARLRATGCLEYLLFTLLLFPCVCLPLSLSSLSSLLLRANSQLDAERPTLPELTSCIEMNYATLVPLSDRCSFFNGSKRPRSNFDGCIKHYWHSMNDRALGL